jgi:hypothetical protein
MLRLHELRTQFLIARSIGIALGGVLEVICFFCVGWGRDVRHETAGLRIRYMMCKGSGKSNIESLSFGPRRSFSSLASADVDIL